MTSAADRDEEEVARALLLVLAEASDTLFAAGITRSDTFTGDIGEFVAARTLGLELVGRNSRAVDGVRDGRGYQVKSVASSDPRAPIPVLNLKTGYDVLVCVRLSLAYEPIELIQIEAVDLPPGTRVVTERLMAVVQSQRTTTFPPDVQSAAVPLRAFADAYRALETAGLITTRHIVGDIGARYAAQRLGLTLVDDPTNAGFDALDSSGRTYEIKTRRVYASERRTSETRRVNGLVGKTADTLVVVRLDHAFRCSGMWSMPLGNVRNPASANMTSILRTPGVEEIQCER